MQHINTERSTHFNRYYPTEMLFVLSSVFHRIFLGLIVRHNLSLVNISGFTFHFGAVFIPLSMVVCGYQMYEKREFSVIPVFSSMFIVWVHWFNAVSRENIHYVQNMFVTIFMSMHDMRRVDNKLHMRLAHIGFSHSFFRRRRRRRKKNVLRSQLHFSRCDVHSGTS